MRIGCRQVCAGLIIALVLSLTNCALGAPVRGPYAKQLAEECDALINAAVKRPYGWAWEVTPAPGVTSKVAPRSVTIEPPGTAAAGVLLLWAGQALEEPRYRTAAYDAARGVIAVQTNSGRFPGRAVFGANAGARDEPAFVPDRGSTCAGLALMLSIIESEDPGKTQSFARAAQHATHWLIKQQNEDGGWPSSYPPDAPAREAQRLIRLDNNDYRNCTYAMLLAAHAGSDRVFSKSANKSIEKLLALRLMIRLDQPPTTEPGEPEQPKVQDERLAELARPLWASAYRPDGSFDLKLDEFPMGADLLASRYAMQTLLGAYLLNSDKNIAEALDLAAESLVNLKREGGKWRRFYVIGPTTVPASRQFVGTGIFSPPPPKIAGVAASELEPLLGVMNELKQSGPEKLAKSGPVELTVQQRLIAGICGLSDTPLVIDPSTATAANLEGPPPEELEARLKRLWVLLIRAKTEMQDQP